MHTSVRVASRRPVSKKSQGGWCPVGRGWQNSVAAHLSDEKRPMTRSLLIEHATPAPVRYWRSLVLLVTHSAHMGFRTLPCALRIARCAYGLSVARHSRVPPQSRKTSDPAEGAGELISSNGGRWAGRRQGLDDAAGGCRSSIFFRRVRAPTCALARHVFRGEFHPRAASSGGVLMPRGSCSGRRPEGPSAWGLLMGRRPRSGSLFWLLSG